MQLRCDHQFVWCLSQIGIGKDKIMKTSVFASALFGCLLLVYLSNDLPVSFVSCDMPEALLNASYGGQLDPCDGDNTDKTPHDCEPDGAIACHTTLKWYEFPDTTPNPDRLLVPYTYCSNASCEDVEGEKTTNDPLCEEPF